VGNTITAAVKADSISNTLLADMATNTIKARVTIATGDPEDAAIAANQFLARSSTGQLAAKAITDFGLSLIDDADAATARTTLGLVAGAAGDIWVEKAGDTMTGNLTISKDTPLVDLRATTGDAIFRAISAVGAEARLLFETSAERKWDLKKVGNEDLVLLRGPTSITNLTIAQATGNATFAGTLAASNLSGTNTGDQIIPPTGVGPPGLDGEGAEDSVSTGGGGPALQGPLGAAVARWPMLFATVEEGEICTIPDGYQMLVGGGFRVSGAMRIDGELHVVS